MENQKLAFSKKNYLVMLLGIFTLVLGYVAMSMETAEHGFGVLGLTVGPILLMIGFLIEFVAIMYRFKK